MPKPIIKGGVRVLRPNEYELLWKGARSQENETRLDGRFIHLPEYAQKKVKRQQRERWIRLSDKGRTIVRYFFKTKPLPSWSGWSRNLERWAESSKLDPV